MFGATNCGNVSGVTDLKLKTIANRNRPASCISQNSDNANFAARRLGVLVYKWAFRQEGFCVFDGSVCGVSRPN
jgi:hypothetical protein